MDAPPKLSRTTSQELSEKLSKRYQIPLEKASQILKACNNDLAKAGHKMFNYVMNATETTQPAHWTKPGETKTTDSGPKHTWSYTKLNSIICFDAKSTCALEKAFQEKKDGIILPNLPNSKSKESIYVDFKKMSIATSIGRLNLLYSLLRYLLLICTDFSFSFICL